MWKCKDFFIKNVIVAANTNKQKNIVGVKKNYSIDT